MVKENAVYQKGTVEMGYRIRDINRIRQIAERKKKGPIHLAYEKEQKQKEKNKIKYHLKDPQL